MEYLVCTKPLCRTVLSTAAETFVYCYCHLQLLCDNFYNTVPLLQNVPMKFANCYLFLKLQVHILCTLSVCWSVFPSGLVYVVFFGYFGNG